MSIHELLVAIRRDQFYLVCSLGRRVPSDASDPQTGWTALHEAARLGRRLIVTHLLDRGARVDARDTVGRTALHLAMRAGHAAVVGDLLEAGANPLAQDDSGIAPLHDAIRAGFLDLVDKMLADPEARTRSGMTPLVTAIMSDRQEIVKLLLRRGADPNAACGLTPLMYAVMRCGGTIVADLVHAGADVARHWNGTTAVHMALHPSTVGEVSKR